MSYRRISHFYSTRGPPRAYYILIDIHMPTSVVRGVAVLDRKSIPLVTKTLSSEDAFAVERIMFASLDMLDSILGHPKHRSDAEEVHAVSEQDVLVKQGGGEGQQHGVYLGLLISQGDMSVYGYLTSVRKRVLLAVKEDKAREKIGDVTLRDILVEIGRVHLDCMANPFGTNSEQFSRGLQGVIDTYIGED